MHETPDVSHAQRPTAWTQDNDDTLLHMLGTDDDIGLTDLSNDELLHLHLLTNKALWNGGVQCVPPVPPQHLPDEFDNAKYEQIACIGLKPCCDGSAAELILMLNFIHTRRQNDTWCPATILPLDDGSEIDIVQPFSKSIHGRCWEESEANLGEQNYSNWLAHQRHSSLPSYYAWLFIVFLTNSLTNEFLTLLYSRINPVYSANNALLLHTMCTCIHRNHIAFVESIKNSIHLSALQESKDDVTLYLCSLQNNLRLISSASESDESNNDLIPHILMQLQCTKTPIFQQSVLKWHRECLEGKLALTPLKLLWMADKESQILKYSNQWVDTINPSITALQVFISKQTTNSQQFLKTLTANLGFHNTTKASSGTQQPPFSDDN